LSTEVGSYYYFIKEGTAMSKTLVMTVGTGRTRTDIAQALLFSIRAHQPDRVVFLCSEVSRDQTLPEIRKELTLPSEYVEVHTFAEENDVQILYQHYLSCLRRCDELIVDYTSGTKAMSAALFAAGIALEAGEVSYITGPRDQTGRAVASTAIVAFPPELVLAERQLARARELFNGLDFHACWQLARPLQKNLPKDSGLRRQAKTLGMLGNAYDLWDHFKWSESAHKLGKASNPRENLVKVDLNRLEANAAFVREVDQNPYGDQRLVDLLNNASRRLQQGRFDDALARLYRAYEYLLQCRFHSQYGINTSDVALDKILKYPLSHSLANYLKKRAESKRGKLELGLKDSLHVLAEMGDQLGLRLVELYWKSGTWQPGKKMIEQDAGPLQGWLNQRNASLMAHGTSPAHESTVTDMLAAYENLLREFIPNLDTLQQAAQLIKL